MTVKRIPGAVSVVALLFLILLLVYSPSPHSQTDESLRLERVQSNRQQGRLMQALYQVEALADQQDWTPELLKLAGDLWNDAGDVTRALPYWEAASLTLSDDRLLMRTLAETYLAMQRWPEAVDHLALLAQSDPADAWAHYHLGLLRVAFDPLAVQAHLQIARTVPEYEMVADALLRVVENDGAGASISAAVGLVLADAELWPYAELAFQHAIDMGQAQPEVFAYAGLARDRQGKDGSLWISRAVAQAPQNPVARFIYGLHLRDQGEFNRSLNALVQAVVLDPTNPAYYAELGTAYQLVDDLENAERWLRMAVETSNQDPRFQRLLALFYAEEAPRLDEGGFSDLEALAALLPDDPEVRAALGWAMYQAGDAEAAMQALDAVLADVPDHPRSLMYKARIYLEAGSLDAARALLDRLVSLDSPFQGEALRMLAGLGGTG